MFFNSWIDYDDDDKPSVYQYTLKKYIHYFAIQTCRKWKLTYCCHCMKSADSQKRNKKLQKKGNKQFLTLLQLDKRKVAGFVLR